MKEFTKNTLIEGAAVDSATRKSVTERGMNRLNQRFREVTPQRAVQKNPPTSIKAKVDKLVDSEKTDVKAHISVSIGGEFVVHGVRMVDSKKKGLFVSMPREPYINSNGEKQYQDICHPITAEARSRLIEAVKNAYDQALMQQSESEAQTESEEINPKL